MTAKAPTTDYVEEKQWPASMYVVDMVNGFKKMDQLRRDGGKNFETRFEITFNRKAPRSSTYYDQVRRWKNASEEIRQAALSAGRTEKGQWARFAQLVRLKF